MGKRNMNTKSNTTSSSPAAPAARSNAFNSRVLDAVQSVGLLFVIIIVGLILSAASPEIGRAHV